MSNIRDNIRLILREFAEELEPMGCEIYPPRSIDRKLCKLLRTNKIKNNFRREFTSVIMRVLESKRRKWSEVIPKTEQDKIFKVLDILKYIHPNRKWQFPSINGNRPMYGTIDDFIKKSFSELAFIYSTDDKNNFQWESVNKLDTNYTDTVNFIMDIIRMSRTFNTEKVYNSLINGDHTVLMEVLNKVKEFPDQVYDKLLKDPSRYVVNSSYYSKQGEDVEQFVLELMLKDGWSLIHKGGNGDPIDVLLGIDLIMEKNGQVKTIQCKKVWNIDYVTKTMMNPNEGAYLLKGKPYISKQRNLDFVGYGTLNGEAVVAKRQREVKRVDNEYIYMDKDTLPRPVGNAPYFYIDNSSVITKTPNINEITRE